MPFTSSILANSFTPESEYHQWVMHETVDKNNTANSDAPGRAVDMEAAVADTKRSQSISLVTIFFCKKSFQVCQLL
jgi:hypothetical protein